MCGKKTAGVAMHTQKAVSLWKSQSNVKETGMFRDNLRKQIKRGAIKGYSNYERFRMFAGAAEVAYLNPSDKRLEEIKSYSTALMKSNYTDLDTKMKASLLHSECASQQVLKNMLSRFSRLRREGVI